MKLPPLTPLQFVVIQLLFHGPKTPPEIRRALRRLGMAQHPGGFTRLVQRLIGSRYVAAVYDGPKPSVRLLKCRLAVSDLGVKVWNATRGFYAGQSPAPRGLKPVATRACKPARRAPRARKGVLRRQAVKETRTAVKRSVRSTLKAKARRRAK